ncbi:MAG TPA: hypothetical protein VM848_01155 [Acidimicrobiia bacterium]|nr:hypothetical protein [Acidimicrobiia bacterium]
MSKWNVPVKLSHALDEPELDGEQVWDLIAAIPGGGPAGSGDEHRIYGREFAYTVEVEAETQIEAEKAAPNRAEEAIASAGYAGWSATLLGEAKLATEA